MGGRVNWGDVKGGVSGFEQSGENVAKRRPVISSWIPGETVSDDM